MSEDSPPRDKPFDGATDTFWSQWLARVRGARVRELGRLLTALRSAKTGIEPKTEGPVYGIFEEEKI